MTTTAELPSWSDADFRLVRMAAIRETAQAQVDGELDADIARERILATSRRAAPTMDEGARADAYEQLVSALARLGYVRSDMWDPAEGDREIADLDADRDTENAVLKLLGDRR